MSSTKRLRPSPMSCTLAALPSLLEFLNVREVAIIVCTQKNADRNSCAAIWFWLNSRTRSLLPAVEPSRPLQWLQTDAMHLVAVLRLLRQLHAIETYTFDLHFDVARHGRDVNLAEHGDSYALRSQPIGGYIFGDRLCMPNAVSYWECVGFEEGCYIGVMDVSTQDYGIDAPHMNPTLSLPTSAFDHISAVIYAEIGFITSGSFRGPKLQILTNVYFVGADPFKVEGHVGVRVDLLAGFLLFVRNGEPQGTRIPINCSKKYLPVFRTDACYKLQLIRDVCPPWRKIYWFDGSLDNQDQYYNYIK
ncbi:unnamed protein product [Peronospora effusa]|nr:unnamed protein product [Peronospora effusa]